MKKLMLAMGMSAATLLSGPALADTYMIDTKGAHASVNFKVPHLGYSFTKGRFPNSTAKCDTLQYQAANVISLKTIAGCLKSKHFFGR